MAITVDSIRKYPFLTRPRSEQIRILLCEEKPRPRLVGFYSEEHGPLANMVVNQDITNNWQTDWLTGCEVQQALYCWPCLLFSLHLSRWNTSGVKGKDILKAIDEHKSCVNHIQAMLDKYMFLRQYSFANSISDVHFNELVRRNHEILKRVIDVVCLLVVQKHPPRMDSNDENELKIEDCLENLQFLQDYDSMGDNIIEDALDVLQFSPNIMTGVIEAIVELVKNAIMKETQSSTFVSMILSVHGTNCAKSQLSTILRFLKDGVVCERFVGFQYFDEKNLRTFLEILLHIDDVVSEFRIKQKLMAIAFDGGLPITKFVMNQLVTALPLQDPCLKFVPCYFHKLHYVLQQSVSVWCDCDYFFKTLKEIGSFFQQNSTRQTNFESFMLSKSYPVNTYDFASTSGSLTYLKYCIKHFIEYFNSTENLSADDFVKVQGYCHFLREFSTLFLINLFIRLFSFTCELNEILQTEMPENASENGMIFKVSTALDYEKKNGFKSLWNVCLIEVRNKEIPQNEIPCNIEVEENTYRALHLDIVKCVRYQIDTRLEHVKGFEFFHLLNPHKISKYCNYDILTSKISTFYGSAFALPLLAKETDILYKTFSGCIFDKSVNQILQFLIQNCNRFAFDNLKKLAELILAMPCKPPSSAGPSVIDRVNAWSCPGNATGDISLLCIEKNIFKALQRKVSFYEEVIIKLQEKNKNIEMLLDYKR